MKAAYGADFDGVMLSEKTFLFVENRIREDRKSIFVFIDLLKCSMTSLTEKVVSLLA